MVLSCPTVSQNLNGNTYQNASADITGLNGSTTYHFRIVAHEECRHKVTAATRHLGRRSEAFAHELWLIASVCVSNLIRKETRRTNIGISRHGMRPEH